MTPTMIHWAANCVLVIIICVIYVAYGIIKEKRHRNV